MRESSKLKSQLNNFMVYHCELKYRFGNDKKFHDCLKIHTIAVSM